MRNIELSGYATQADAQAALNGGAAKVNVPLGTSDAGAFYFQGNITVPAGKILMMENCKFYPGNDGTITAPDGRGTAPGTITVAGQPFMIRASTGFIRSP